MSRREPVQVHRADSFGMGCTLRVSDRDGTPDGRVVLIALDHDVLVRVAIDGIGLTGEPQHRVRVRCARQLLCYLLDVVVIDVHVATRPDEVAQFQATLVRDHHRQ